MKPVIALVGRPNVGKSTLFNRLTKTRDAIVADFAGLTRDRHYGDARVGGREFIVVDTGGFEPENPTGIVTEMAQQTQPGGRRGRRGDLRRRRARRRCRRRTTTSRATCARPASASCSRSTRPRAWPSRRCSAEFHELGLGEPHPDLGGARRGRAQPARARRSTRVRAGDEADDDERRRPTSAERRSGWRSSAGRTSASRRWSTPGSARSA